MNAPNDNTKALGLRGWWLSPPRPGLHRLINPWEFRRRLRHRNADGRCHCGRVPDGGTNTPLSSTHEASSWTALVPQGAKLSSHARE